MKKGSKYITRSQRFKLEDCFNAGLSKQKIAEKIGMSVRTVYRELQRGKYEKRVKKYDCYGFSRYVTKTMYSADLAEERAKMEMTKKGAPIKLGHDYEFASYVEKRVMKDGISPCVLVGEMKRMGIFQTNVCKTTLYRYISLGFFLHLRMKHLPYYKKKKHYRKTTAKRAPRGTSIEQRPVCILERNIFGHWEMDCIVGPSLHTLLVFTERKTRKEIIIRMPNRTTASVVNALNKLEARYGKRFKQIFKSITVDNGVEFSDVEGMEKSVYGGNRTTFYYCHPYTPCERGSNERINRDIRRIFPKGTDFAKVSDNEVQKCEDWVNAYPREIFGFASSAEKFNEELAKIA
ncbi:MAG: IS30 family transposase [Candidatus Scatosoma sp.]